VARVLEHLPSKREALSSNPSLKTRLKGEIFVSTQCTESYRCHLMSHWKEEDMEPRGE
jgi:hypothetical protein